jgi:cytochrome c-type biogenesis protein
MVGELSIAVAFTAGLVSFLSPCILPLVPGILSYLAGESTSHRPSRRETFYASIWFVAGFITVFAALGITLNTVLAHVAYDVHVWLSRVGGALLIVFGAHLAGIVRVRFLERSYTVHVPSGITSRQLMAFAFGAAFAIGWTPCAGAALGAILGLAAHAPHTSFALLLAYAAGLGLPFLLSGLVAVDMQRLLIKATRYTRILTIFFGLLLIGIGILIATQTLNQVTTLLSW